ncbi:MAG: hypothetical protein ACFFBJ_12875 [Promethearchaeota archaeon]
MVRFQCTSGKGMLRVITVQIKSDPERVSMVQFHIFTPSVNEFISLIEQQKNIRWKKVWYVEEKIIGVYFIEVIPSRFSTESALLNIVIEHDQKEKFCQIWIEPFGIGHVSPDRKMMDLIHSIGYIATSNDWRFERVPISYRGDTCPHCNATYVYEEAESLETTKRVCQNCGKQFDIDEPRDAEREWGEIRYRRTPCPYCKAVYLYNKSHLREDGTVVCQNCGGIFLLPIDDWTRYSYEWYQEDSDIIQ